MILISFAVPSEGPREINVTALSSTSVKVTFSEIPTNAQNGLIRGYKVGVKALYRTDYYILPMPPII